MEYTRDTQCDRCHCWYDKADLNQVNGWSICTRCVEALYPSDDDEFGRRVDHEGQFEDEPVVYEPVAEHPNALLTRSSGGLRVEGCYMPLTDLYGVALTLDGKQAWASCTPEQFLDAFHHPALYVSPVALAHIGLR